MIKLLGVPYDENSSFLKGAALAPPVIRQMEADGSANTFSEDLNEFSTGKTYLDGGDLQLNGLKPRAAYEEIKRAVGAELDSGHSLICLGGDHSVSFPIIEAYSQRFEKLNILHFDAHPDLYDNFEDNPFSHASPFARLMELGTIGSLTQVGIRTLNPHQRQQAQRFSVNVCEIKDFSYDFIAKLEAPLYVSIDIDALDPAFAPGVSHHEPGGMSSREMIKAIQSIPFPIIGADIVEYNPTRDINNMTAMVAYKLFKELAAKMVA